MESKDAINMVVPLWQKMVLQSDRSIFFFVFVLFFGLSFSRIPTTSASASIEPIC